MADLARARANLQVFAAIVGCALEDFQWRALELLTRITAITAPRQSGKSRALAVLALWWAFREPGQKVLIVSAGEEASRRLLAEVRRIAQGSPLLRGSVVDEQAGLVRLSNGSEIRSVPASERQVRGWTVDLLLVDEAAMVSDDLLLGAAIPTTAARPAARIVLASSATVAAGAFYDHVRLGEAGSEHVRAFRWSLTDCHWISASAIAAARESMSELRFAAEYEGIFAGSSDALFSRATLERATVDYLHDTIDTAHGPSRNLGGQDWGLVRDRCTLVVIGRPAIADGRRVYAVRVAKRWPEAYPIHLVPQEIGASPVLFDILNAEAVGMGGPMNQLLWRSIYNRPFDRGGGRLPPALVVVEERGTAPWDWDGRPKVKRRERGAGFVTTKRDVQTSAALKAGVYSSLRLLVDQGKLIFPAAAEELLRELLLLRIDLTASGLERVEVSSGAFDDLADALAFATTPIKREAGWSTYLTALANPASVLPEPVLPAAVWAQDHVEGADGLRMPRRPAWLSVKGSEFTLPPNLDLSDPARRALREQVRVALTQSTGSEQQNGR